MRFEVCRIIAVAFVALVNVSSASAKDRSVVFFPLPANSAPESIDSANVGRLPNVGLATGADAAWANYLRLWDAHHRLPSQPAIRAFLGLPATTGVDPTPTRGRASLKFPAWRAGSYQQLDTHHFQILSRADDALTQQVAADAERFYWIWSQLFFPFWEGSLGIDRSLGSLAEDADVATSVGKLPALRSARPRMRIVIFRDAAEYQNTLVRDEPGVAQSTGYYSDKLQSTFLYGGIAPENIDDAGATRHHELTHQLFREATFSRLGRQSPGETKDFWLVEGIAGYMESLAMLGSVATVGGWDSERLQYARYRILVGGDALLLEEMRGEGRLAVQRRSDLARLYAHAIAQTHCLLDGDESGSRQWIYNELGELYRINTSFAVAQPPANEQQQLHEFLLVDDEQLRANNHVLPPRKLCLAACEVTTDGLSLVPPSDRITWLDLSRIQNLSIADVKRLCVDPTSLTSLSLEATPIDAAEAATWLARATLLEELDLSSTPIDDSLATSLRSMNELETLWLTGSRVGDEIIDAVISRTKLQTVDLQRTAVTDTGISKLRAARPDLRINPLEVR